MPCLLFIQFLTRILGRLSIYYGFYIVVSPADLCISNDYLFDGLRYIQLMVVFSYFSSLALQALILV